MKGRKIILKETGVLLIALLCILAIPAVNAQPLPVYGYIYECDGTTPIAGALVTVTDINTAYSYSDISESDGFYSVTFGIGETNIGDTLVISVNCTGAYNGWVGEATVIKLTTAPLQENLILCWYYKPSSMGAPHGMPDFPRGYIDYFDSPACVVANCFWWFDGRNTLYNNIVTTDPQTLVNNLYFYLGPDPSYSLISSTISDWLVAAGLNTLLYVNVITNPNFYQITEEIEICSDVILVLHDDYSAKYYLTCAGFNPNLVSLAVSDPLNNFAQNGMGPGRYYNAPPDHWNPANVSHDHHLVLLSPIALIYPWGPLYIDAAILLKEFNLNQPPTACFTWLDADGAGSGMTVNFDAGCSTDDDNISLYEWDWTYDGVYDYTGGSTTSHDYGDTNTHTCALRVTDTISQTDVFSDIVQAQSAVEVLDVNQPVFTRGFPVRHALDGDWAGAQNFTPTVNTLTKVEIYLRKMGTPEFNLTVELRENGPQGTLLDAVVIPIASVPTSWTWLTIDFDNTTVGIGSDVFIVLPPAPSGVSTSFGYEWGYALGNQYNGGSFWFTRNGGVLWRDLPTMYEFTFKTYGFMSQTEETLFENFEGSFPPTGWTHQVVSGTDPDNYWKINDTVTYPTGIIPISGIHMAEFDIYIILNGNSARLYTPALAFSGTGTQVSFMMYHDDDSTTYTDRVVIQVSIDGSTWTDITQFYTWDTTEGWKNHIVDLSAYDGQPSVYVGFLGISNYGYNNVYIDDVEVSC